MPSKSVICFGEVLWDLLPSGKVAGGAPMNVAFHLHNLGMSSAMISQVGDDKLGEELLNFLKNHGIKTELIGINETFPTSTVKVYLDEHGSPSYEIVEPVAWDYITINNTQKKAVETADALVFGSLASRTDRSKRTLMELAVLAKCRILDVNLRAPFYNQLIIEGLLQVSDIVKLSEEELATITKWYWGHLSEKEGLVFLRDKFDIKTIILTKGGEGAFCLHQDQYFEQSIYPVKVIDTIGSGDAFLSGFIKKMFDGADVQDCLRFAAALGALVASSKGATPIINENMVSEFIADPRSAITSNNQ